VLAATAAGFAGVGGRGRVLDTLLAGVCCVVAFFAGWRRAWLVAAVGVAGFLLVEWNADRLGHNRYWQDVLFSAGVAGATLAAAHLRTAVDARGALMGAALARSASERELDAIDEALGLGKHRAGSLAYELERARRHNHAMSILLVRPDDLDQIAMQYGEDAAVKVMQTVAGVIGGSLRGTDIAARQPPFDFAVILPETSRDEARMVAERIRLTVCEQRLEFGPGDVVDLTVAVGVASFPHDATSNDEMTDVLNRALAGAVESGGNRTILYSVPQDAPAGWGLGRDLR
jgi:diguanylate cyclase (GGDEF)-like protein